MCNLNISKVRRISNHDFGQAGADIPTIPCSFILSIKASGVGPLKTPATESAPSHPLHRPVTHNNVPSFDKLQAYLEHGDVQEVDEVTEVIHQQPEVDVAWRLIREGPTHRNQPAVPVPGHHHEEQPQDVHQVCAEGRGGDVPAHQPDRLLAVGPGCGFLPLVYLRLPVSTVCDNSVTWWGWRSG